MVTEVYWGWRIYFERGFYMVVGGGFSVFFCGRTLYKSMVLGGKGYRGMWGFFFLRERVFRF